MSRPDRWLVPCVAVVLLGAALVAMEARGGGSVRVTVEDSPTPIVAPAELRDLLADTPQAASEEVRDVAGVRASDEWERAVRSSASPLPLPANATPHELGTVEPTAEVAQPAERPARNGEVVGSTPALGSRLTQDELYELALAVSGSPVWALQAAVVAHCESRGVVNAVGAAGEAGVLQIHPVHTDLHARYELDDPLQNIEAAYELWSEAGWRPWSCRP